MGQFLTAHRFCGIDARTNPGDLHLISPGKTPVAQNVYAYGGDYLSRPGVKALLATSHAPNAVYIGCLFLKADGSQWIIYAAGMPNETTGGTLWMAEVSDLSGIGTGIVATEIVDADTGESFSINASAFRACTAGIYAYLVWGGPTIYRTDLASNTASALTAMIAPVSPITAALTTGQVFSGFDPNTAAYDAPSTANVFPDSSSASWGGSNGYTQGGGIDYRGAGQSFAVLCDFAGNPEAPAFYQGYVWANFNGVSGKFITTPLIAGVQHTDGSGDWANQFSFGFLYYQGNGYAGVTITAEVYSDSGGTILVGTQEFTLLPVGPVLGFSAFQQANVLFDFTGQGLTIQSWKFTLSAVKPNGGGTIDNGLQIAFLTGFPCWGLLTPPYGGSQPGNYQNGYWYSVPDGVPSFSPVVGAGTPNNPYIGETTPAVPPDPYLTPARFNCFLKDARLTVTFGSDQNFSSYSEITIAMKGLGSLGSLDFEDPTLALELRLLQSGSGNTFQAVPLTISNDGTYAYGDISSVPATVLASVAAMQIVFVDNPLIQSAALHFNFGGLQSSGNLPVPPTTATSGYAPVSYAFEEIDSVGDFTVSDPIESAGSPASNTLQPVPNQATGSGTLPAPVNPNTDYMTVFRAGGTFLDGLYRLIGTFPLAYSISAPVSLSDLAVPAGESLQLESATRPAVSGDVGQTIYIPLPVAAGFNAGLYEVTGISGSAWVLNASAGTPGSTGGTGTFGGDNLNRDQQNPYVTWDAPSRSFIDNTPDSYLNAALILQINRDLPPSGAIEVRYWQDRIMVLTPEGTRLTWSLIEDAQNGIYFSDTSDFSTDPSYAIKGFQDDISPGDNDPVRAGLSLDSQFLTFKGLQAALLMGYDPSNFAQQTYLSSAGNGCVGVRACTTYDNQALYLSWDDVYQFDGDTVQRRSIEIGPLIHPDGNNGSARVSPAAKALAAMFVYQGRLHLLHPLPGGSNNAVDYVWDFIEQAWTEWIYPTGMTSGATLTPSSDGGNAFLGGLDGQLYAFAPGQGDQTSPEGPVVPVAGSVISRGMGQEIAQYSPSAEIGVIGVLENDASDYYGDFLAPSEGCQITTIAYADENNAAGDPTYQSNSYDLPAGRTKIKWGLEPGTFGTLVFAGVGFSVSQGQFGVRSLGLSVNKRSPEL
jgi:hypothetical protein